MSMVSLCVVAPTVYSMLQHLFHYTLVQKDTMMKYKIPTLNNLQLYSDLRTTITETGESGTT